VRIVALVAVVALVLAGLASWLVAGRVLEPVRLVRQTAEQISESDLRRRIPVTGHDDVARLASTFNRMLDRLERAFATQRQFVDDAGHELRTPITVVRGHLELLDDDPADRQRALDLVMDELDRMNRIVDDLLLLAKAERPDFLRLGDVVVPELIVDVVAKARALGPRRWAIDEMADVVVLADEQRLTQALMQLAANAVQHTVAEDRIGVGSRVEHGRLLLWVSDHGTGVGAADHERIFERFQRAAGSKREGAGLGLAIVRSIAHAHGGEVRLESDTGRGATFTLDLPLHLVDHREEVGSVPSSVPVDHEDHEEVRR
jgi:signal transduction histidine kinase